MALQEIMDRRRPAQQVHVFPVAKTISGTGGAGLAILTGIPSGSLPTVLGSEWVSNATVGVSFGGLYYVGAYVGESEYDPAFVNEILAADAEPAVEGFDNVVDLLDWLNRD